MARKKKADDDDLIGNPGANDVGSAELRSFVERIEALEVDAKAIADDKKEVYAEAKGRGYDVKVLRKIISERKRDRDDIQEEMAILDLYRAALGMV